MKKFFLIVAVAILFGDFLPLQAQGQPEEFTVATLNVDGLPDELVGIPINPEGPGEKYTPEIADYLLDKNYDFVGFQENFNYYDYLFPKLESNYQHDKCYGKMSLETFALPYPYDGINLIWRNGIKGERADSARWVEAYGFIDHSSDELTNKGYRRYDLTLGGGSQVVVYNGHWDASDDVDEESGQDGPDRVVRLKQWIQLRDTIMKHLDDRPIIVMGDVNSYYCRDSVKHYFVDFIEATGKAKVFDAWVELERNGEYPEIIEGPITHDKGGSGWVRQGEMVDKILFINPTDGSKLTALSFSVDSLTYMRSDDPEAPLGDHFPVAVKFRIDPPEVLAQTNWMENLDDGRLVTDLSLPGTHDAATAEGWYGMADTDVGGFSFGDLAARAQDLTIAEQWAVGVRVFDIRPQVDEGVLRCMHGITGTNLLVGDFFAKLRDLLAASPTEFAIVTTKIDTSAGEPEVVEWAPLFDSLIHSDSLSQCFVEFSPTMTVGDVRGKILLLSRNKYADVPLGGFITGWSSDKDFANQQSGTITGSDGSSCQLWMQDYYDIYHDREGKDEAIIRMLDAAMARDLTTTKPAWVMNYAAGNTKTPYSDGYRDNAVDANQVVIDYLADESHNGSTGIVFMDYAGVSQSKSCSEETVYEVKGLELVQALIAQNFRGGQTAIRDLTESSLNASSNKGWFTLSGTRLTNRPSAPGIYIFNGKKILIK